MNQHETAEESRLMIVTNVSELNKIKALTLINSQWMLVSSLRIN